MSYLLYFIGKYYQAEIATDLFYYLKFPSRVYNLPILLSKIFGQVYNKKGNRGPSLHLPDKK
jgi:hypothetical protein